MLIVDASCLYEVIAATPRAEGIRARLAAEQDLAAPQVIDAEILGVVRRHEIEGRLDATAAAQAIEDLRDWPAERFGHRGLIRRAWELRATVRTWDALYVALAEALDGTLLTSDRRLARARGPRCRIEIAPGP